MVIPVYSDIDQIQYPNPDSARQAHHDFDLVLPDSDIYMEATIAIDNKHDLYHTRDIARHSS
ncbi:hypothetical protein ACJMK2_041198 [Sinanodonta woodiana]|uniref:Uncharacterized protein n=1 Tax=Sinanodonta woodiana TaxID=1069815 RepID=A0ABD3W6J5_SINWO